MRKDLLPQPRLVFHWWCAALAALLAGPAGAAKPPAAAPKVVRLELSPSRLELLGRPASERVFVTAVQADGNREDVTERAAFTVRSGVIRAAGRGSLQAVRDGQTVVSVTHSGRTASLPVRVSKTNAEQPVSFRYDV